VSAAVVQLILFFATSFHRGKSKVLANGVDCSGAVDNFTPTSFHRCKSQVLASGVG
jgi:hypothetical protein